MTTEFAQKLSRLRLMMAAGNYDSIHITQPENIFWLLCGADLGFRARYKLGAEKLGAEIVVTSKKVVLVAAESQKETLVTVALPKELECVYAPLMTYVSVVHDLLKGRVLADDSSSGFEHKNFWLLRVPLTLEEISRYRDLSKKLSDALIDVLPNVKPGMTGQQVFDKLYEVLATHGLTPMSLFVFSDDVLEDYTEIFDKSKKIKNRFSVDISVCKYGLMARVTRMVQFGLPSRETQQRYQHLLELEKTILDYTQHAVLTGELWRELQEHTKRLPYGSKWKHYLYGGAIGYKSHDFEIYKERGGMLVDGSAYAWNLALPGVRVQDMFLLLNDKLEVLTHDERWPSREIGGRKRPEVLEL
jgi:Xaa-Pro aminopeptidase